ncbi:MAG: hypothetical protein QXO12_03025, partial [Candidatus Pacearchaeota archaeon]
FMFWYWHFYLKKIANNVPNIKKGQNGILDFKVFFLKIKRKIEIIAPKIKEKVKAKKIILKSKISAIKTENQKSPQPNHFSFEIKIKKRKMKEGKNGKKNSEIF